LKRISVMKVQVDDRGVQLGARRELFVVDGQDERRGARLPLGELRQVPVARDAQHLHPSSSIALASARMPRPEVFSER
jgi:hypothetical protein